MVLCTNLEQTEIKDSNEKCELHLKQLFKEKL